MPTRILKARYFFLGSYSLNLFGMCIPTVPEVVEDPSIPVENLILLGLTLPDEEIVFPIIFGPGFGFGLSDPVPPAKRGRFEFGDPGDPDFL